MPSLQLFLSYNRADERAVMGVRKLLEARGITTFLDRYELGAGLPWPQALEDGLRDVHGVVVFVGRELGGWQKREMWFALDRQVREETQGRTFPVIPVLLQGADLTACFLFVNTWVDLRGGLEGGRTGEVLDAFERAIKSTEPASVSEGSGTQAGDRAAAICPYRGLQFFREEDAAFFAGRTAFADQLLHFTRGKDLVVVVGPSGSGKSSVVQAGLLPRLRREREKTWDVVTFTPGSDPFHRLASALIPFLEPDKDEVERLEEAEELGANLAGGRTRVEAVFNRVIEKSNGTGRVLLVADQFEELFTLTPEPGRRPFAQALLRALGNAPFTLLVTLRADFYSQIITLDRALSDRLAPAQVNLGALTLAELRESITEPAKLVGLEFEPGLVERLLADVGGEPGHLPLLEFALTELWQRREGKVVANRAYNEIGCVTGVLARRAEAEFARLRPEEQTAVRRLFSRLVRVARPEEAGEDTRQRTHLSDADAVERRVASELADARLLVTGGDAHNGNLSVEIAHEALIRNWDRLRGWLNEDREFLLWRQRSQVQVGEWKEHRQDVGYLLRGVPLSEAESWLLGRPQDLTDAEQHFILESVALRKREWAEEEQRRQAEIENAKRLKEAAEATAVAEQQRAAEQARRATVLRRSALALGVMLMLAFAAVVIAFWQRSLAQAREFVAASRTSEDTDPELSILIATQGVAATWPWGHYVLAEAEEQLHHSLLASHVEITLVGHKDYVWSVTWSPDRKRLATASRDHTARVWDAASGKELLTLRGHTNDVMCVAWSPDGKRLATASLDQTAKVWDAESGKELLSLSGHSKDVMSVAWSPDGHWLATGSFDRTAKVWDAASGNELLTLSPQAFVMSVAWSPDSQRLATVAGASTAKVWDRESGKELLTLSGHGNAVWSVIWSPDGKRLATASADHTAKVWDVESGKELLTLRGHSDGVQSVAWTADSGRLATGSRDNTAKVWDLGSGKEQLVLSGHTDSVESVVWSPDGKRVATASEDHTAKVWDVADGKELLTLGGRRSNLFDLGRMEFLTIGGHRSDVESVVWSPDGKRLATASADHRAKVWDASSGEELLTFSGHSNSVFAVAWSPDGKRLATGGADKVARVWDASSGKELVTLSGHTGRVLSVAWSPNGKRLATASDDETVKVWDAVSGKELLTLGGHRGAVESVAWSPNGQRIATGVEDQTAKVWDAVSGRELLTLRGHGNGVWSVAWNSGGQRLATGSYDGTAKVLDAVNGKELVTLTGHAGRVLSVAWSPNGKRLATASDDRTVQIYAIDFRELMQLARQRVTAQPSEQGCKKYLHMDKCPPVPQLPFW
jgi:WD40 repeat protein